MYQEIIQLGANGLHSVCENILIFFFLNYSFFIKFLSFTDGSDEEANALLGSLDSAFLFAYAGAMFVSGKFFFFNYIRFKLELYLLYIF